MPMPMLAAYTCFACGDIDEVVHAESTQNDEESPYDFSPPSVPMSEDLSSDVNDAAVRHLGGRHPQ